MIVKLLVDAGDMKPGPAISQKLGPIGINIGKVVQEVNKATAEFRGIKVPVILNVDTKTRDFTVEVKTPPTSELLKKELGAEKGSGAAEKIKVGNAALEQIIKVAKMKQQDMLCSFRESVKSVLGTCVSLGIIVENKDPREIIKEIEEGKHKEIIEKQIDSASSEKIEKLQEYFKQIKTKQEEAAKAAEAAVVAKTPAAETKPEAVEKIEKVEKEAVKEKAKPVEEKRVERKRK